MQEAKCDEIKLEALKWDMKTNGVSPAIRASNFQWSGFHLFLSLRHSWDLQGPGHCPRPSHYQHYPHHCSSLPPPLTHSLHCCLTKFTEVILLEVTLFVLPTEVWMTEIYTGCGGPEKIRFLIWGSLNYLSDCVFVHIINLHPFHNNTWLFDISTG